RFDENNCHAECRHCNRFKADHLEGYRVNLIAKIGQQPFPTSMRSRETIRPTISTSAAPFTFGTVSSMDLPDVVTSSIITTRSPSFNLL
ncbi:recombination protein NinG, partial [Bacillus safensis]|uniref:recombination protein NinG n=1 Tax=Bacillus safensis TaxID=561879 RepID=UPI003AA86C13